MSDYTLKGKTVLAKFDGDGDFVPIKVLEYDGAAIWYQNDSLVAEAVGEGRIIPPYLGLETKPLLFVPLSRIQWLLVPDTEAH